MSLNSAGIKPVDTSGLTIKGGDAGVIDGNGALVDEDDTDGNGVLVDGEDTDGNVDGAGGEDNDVLIDGASGEDTGGREDSIEAAAGASDIMPEVLEFGDVHWEVD